MKIVLWIVFAVLALLWTGGAALLAQLAQWSATGLAAGGDTPGAVVAGVAGVASTATLPAWLAPWIDPAAWTAAQQALTEGWTALSASLPFIGSTVGTALGWLVPVIWTLWALGFVLMLLVAAVAHWAIGRFQRSGPGGPGAVPA